MDRFVAETRIKQQAEKRKTIDLDLLRKFVVTRLNDVHQAAGENDGLDDHGYGWKDHQRYSGGDRLSYLDGVTAVLESMLHMLDMYGGFHSRTWNAFCQLDGWLDLVHRLQAHDDTHDARLYWDLLRDLDFGHDRFRSVPRQWYSNYDLCRSRPPTEFETQWAKWAMDKYLKILEEKE